MDKDLEWDIVNVLKTASDDYRAFAQQQRESGQVDNAVRYSDRADKCYDLARRMDNLVLP